MLDLFRRVWTRKTVRRDTLYNVFRCYMLRDLTWSYADYWRFSDFWAFWVFLLFNSWETNWTWLVARIRQSWWGLKHRWQNASLSFARKKLNISRKRKVLRGLSTILNCVWVKLFFNLAWKYFNICWKIKFTNLLEGFVWMYIYLYICIYIYRYICIYIYMVLCECMCAYISIYICTTWFSICVICILHVLYKHKCMYKCINSNIYNTHKCIYM